MRFATLMFRCCCYALLLCLFDVAAAFAIARGYYAAMPPCQPLRYALRHHAAADSHHADVTLFDADTLRAPPLMLRAMLFARDATPR